jgi:ferric-dicitrate binding protein FerR (iron transport regulator)
MEIKDNKQATDRAWSRLHSRLEHEGLLNEEQKGGHRQPLRIIAWTMSLAAVLVLGFFVVRGFISTPEKDIIVVNTSSDDMGSAFLATVLNDGSIVYIADSATFSYPVQFDDNKREVTLTGEAFFDIKENNEKPFYIETDSAYIEVTGTMFGVQSFTSGNFKVSVSNGEVRVRLKNNQQSIVVEAGESIILDANSLRKVHDERALQFEPYHGKIYFKDMRLSDIVTIINKQNEEKSLMLAPGLDDYMLTATFAKDEPAVIADLICRTLNLQFSYREDGIIIHERQ